MVRSKSSPRRGLTDCGFSEGPRNEQEPHVCGNAAVNVGLSTAGKHVREPSKSNRPRPRQPLLQYPPPLPRLDQSSGRRFYRRKTRSSEYLTRLKSSRTTESGPSLASSAPNANLREMLRRQVLPHAWMPQWETYTPLEVDSYIAPKCVAAVVIDDVVFTAGDRLDARASEPSSVYVRHMAPECYIGTSKPSYYNSAAFRSASQSWRHFPEYQSSLTALQCRVVTEIGEPLEATLETNMPFVPVAIAFLVRFSVVHMSYSRGSLIFFLRDRQAETDGRPMHAEERTKDQHRVETSATRTDGSRTEFSVHSPRVNVALGLFFRWILNRELAAQMQQSAPLTISWLHDAVRRTLDDSGSHESAPFHHKLKDTSNLLRVKLRPYQERAVAWMLSRELTPCSSSVTETDPWVHLEAADEEFDDNLATVHLARQWCMNPCTGEYCLDRESPPAHVINRDSYYTSGGLLCEEMGLGKTVEVISLVLANPRNLTLDSARPLPDLGSLNNVSCVECAKCIDFRRSSSGLDASRQAKRYKSSASVYHQPTSTSSWTMCRECYGFAHRACSQLGDSEQSARKGFVCQSCLKVFDRFGGSRKLVQSKATLIVVPQMLLEQWIDELERHGPRSLAVIVFDGLSGNSGYVGLQTLVRADIVITTYDALRSDVAVLAQMQSTRTLRRPKRYRATPTPLLNVNWWRVCLDEAQMVESGASSQARMAKELSAEHRWCVTGTPARHDICELGELLCFLKVSPCARASRWVNEVVHPAELGAVADRERLQRILRTLMWRTCKGDVEGVELHLPEQSTQVVRLDLGPIEKYFYSDIWEQVRSDVLGQHELVESQRFLSTFSSLQRLRQACCHPQVGASRRHLVGDSNAARARILGRNRFRNGDRVRKSRKVAPALAAQKRAENPMTMGEVLNSMVSRARVECQEAQRIMIAAGNGLAGVSLLENGPSSICQAVKLYREVLQLAGKSQNVCEVDRIQILHVLHNLRDAHRIVSSLSENSPSETEIDELQALGMSPREANLDDEIEKLKRSYLMDARNRLDVAMSSSRVARNKADALCKRLDGNRGGIRGGFDGFRWWSTAIGHVLEHGDPTVFLERLVRELMDALPINSAGVDSIAHRLTSLPAVATILSSSLDKLWDARMALLERLEELPGAKEPTLAEISESGQCRSCRAYEAQGSECAHCRAEHLLDQYERLLYHMHGPSVSEKRKYFSSSIGEGDISHLEISGNLRGDSAAITRNMTQALRPRRRPQVATFVAPVRSEVERILRILAAVVRSGGNADSREEMQLWFEMLEALKKEFVACKTAFDAQREFLGSCDELDQAMQRISLLDRDIPVSELTPHQRLFTISQAMLPALHADFTSEKTAADVTFRTKRSDLMYLMSLANDHNRAEGELSSTDKNSEQVAASFSCPVCLGQMGQDIALLSCGHRFCSKCTRVLMSRSGRRGNKHLSCPTCRRASRVHDVYFAPAKEAKSVAEAGPIELADQKKEEAGHQDGPFCARTIESALTKRSPKKPRTLPCLYPGETLSSFHDSSIAVLGSSSSKLTAVVRLLKSIKRIDESAKTLVFSQWNEVLGIIGNELKENSIEFCSLVGCAFRGRVEGSAAQILRVFKTSRSCNVLLLPFARGAAGLNLVEATHVILVEPSLNPAIESQAVSRVHRISQENKTFVHRLIMNDTIEDNVRKIAVSRQHLAVEAAVEETVTEDEVIELFEAAGEVDLES